MTIEMLSRIEGGTALIHHFGRCPSFHDAEIIHLHLNRGAESILQVHAFTMTNQLDDANHYLREGHTLIDFCMAGVDDCDLQSFNAQNVIDDIRIEQDTRMRVIIDDIYGLSGSIQCASLRIEFSGGKPSDRSDS